MISRLIMISLVVIANSATAQSVQDIERQVANVERAFAATMADRDFDAFSSFIADDAVFWTGDRPLRGKEAVLSVWRDYFIDEEPPFYWKPETVMVIEGGGLALSTGPVWGQDNVVRSYYTSIWRQNPAGEWKIIFDKGQKYCETCAEAD